MSVGKTYVMGDIHGEYRALISCLEQVNFDYENDTLIQLGDVVDRGKQSFDCIKELLKIKNLIAIRGNHDQCFINGLHSGYYLLMNQGCKETIESYINSLDLPDKLYISNYEWVTTFDIEGVPVSHFKFFNNQKLYHIDSKNRLFVHAGIDRHHSIYDEINNTHDVFLWDRDFINSARSYSTAKLGEFKIKDNFKEIFLGHTPTQCFGEEKPLTFGNIHLLDTGCGKGGKLTIMDLETKQYWQSL